MARHAKALVSTDLELDHYHRVHLSATSPQCQFHLRLLREKMKETRANHSKLAPDRNRKLSVRLGAKV